MSPDGPAKPPPEEKLLKLIREKGAPSTATASVASGGAGAAMSSGVLAAEDALRARQLPWPKIAVVVLSLTLLIEVGWLVIQAMRPATIISVPTIQAPTSTNEAPIESHEMDQPPSLSEGASPSLFTPPATVETPGGQPTATKSAPSQTAKQLASRLTLMGIVAGNPAQAIIEDAQTKKSYFVTPGQPVVEGAVVEQVLDNRVILDLNGEKIELSL